MKISLNQHKSYVDINDPVEELCDRMVMAGFEVESIEKQGENLVNVVAARIVELSPHEDSDHLQICQMDIGTGELVQIVTGAQNIKVGDLVPAALDNSRLPNGMNIKAGKLRGVPSNGMLCSGEELCLTEADYEGASVNGILILKDEYPAGTDMREILHLNDYIIDFKITANRPDCNCVLGVAREVGVVLGTKFNAPVPKYETCGGDINDYISVDVKNYDLCPRYVGRFVKNLKIKESPDWLKRCIKASGMRPINNIVDITNFVMLETGQPMHAFDYRDIKGGKIIVRNAADGEKITTLDEKEHTLNSEMLVIADAENPSCLAGIMGGLNSEIKPDTADLFLESAKFKRDNVRRTGRTLGVRTESSGRFERGTDIMNTEYAMNRALQLIYDLDAGDIIDGTIDKNAGLPDERILTVDANRINALLGVQIPFETMVTILNSLTIETVLNGDTLTCKIPSHRDDIEGMADLAEEVMRIYGYDHIIGTAMKGSVVRGKLLPERIKANAIKKLMNALGAYEITTYSFISSKAIDTLNLAEDDERRNAIRLINPLGDEYSVMRTQLITSMLTVLATNINRKNAGARFFEISKRFVPKSLPLTEQPLEIPTMSIGVYGDDEDFFTLKGIVEELVCAFDMKPAFERSEETYLHPGRQAAAVANGKAVAVFGEVHPDVAANYAISDKVYVAEIRLDLLYSAEISQKIYKALPKFPAVTRDFAMLCDKEILVGTLCDTAEKAAGKLCEEVKLFDVYEGAQIPEGKKSVAISVTLRSSEATLTDSEIETVSNKIISKLEAIGAELRK